ncbi:MAG: cytochrome c [Pseudomonadota bacterium]|nr:cytochrome c [Pseudomonadota bacterium]
MAAAVFALICVPAAQAGASTALSRGAYLAKAGDCIACHIANPGGQPFVGGLPMHSPFGTIYTSNITPDPQTGIGRYTLEDFSRALRHGVRRDGKRLYPAMPFASYAAATDDDIAALYYYFMKEVAPVKSEPPQTALAFPFNQRWLLYFWDAAFVQHAVFKPHDDRSVEWNRGAYLVRTLGHCGACHTPRGIAYQERGYDESSPLFLTGAVVDHWYSVNLNGDRAAGLGRRSAADIVQFLRTGHGAGDAAFGSMKDVVQDSTQYLSDADVAAIADYLKSLPARGERARFRPAATIPEPALARINEQPGAGIYNGFCLKCHGVDGRGKPGKFPALAGNPSVLQPNPDALIRLLIEGSTAPATATGPAPEKMPAFATKISDTDMADVLTYIRRNWGNQANAVTHRAAGKLHATLREQKQSELAKQGRPLPQ